MNLARLIIAAALAVLAAAGNYYWLYSNQNSGVACMAVEAEVAEGTMWKPEHFVRLNIPGEEDEVRKTFVPYDDMPLVIGLPASRNYAAGDVVLQQDLTIAKPNWRALGPFRLISVGERIRSGNTYSEGRDTGTVTISASLNSEGNYDAKTERLLDIVAAQSDRKSKLRIIAIQLDPPPRDAPMADNEYGSFDEDVSIDLRQDERGLMIPLRGVESIPEVMVHGSYISFVVQWFDELRENGGSVN